MIKSEFRHILRVSTAECIELLLVWIAGFYINEHVIYTSSCCISVVFKRVYVR